jgi:hypothetical protein
MNVPPAANPLNQVLAGVTIEVVLDEEPSAI